MIRVSTFADTCVCRGILATVLMNMYLYESEHNSVLKNDMLVYINSVQASIVLHRKRSWTSECDGIRLGLTTAEGPYS